MLSFARSLILSAGLFFAAAGFLRADTLILANGDRIKGTLIKNVDSIITFKSDILGEIIVPTTKAKVEVDLTPEQQAALAEKAAEARRIADAKAKEEAEKKQAAEKKTATKKRRVPTPPPSFVDVRTLGKDPAKGTLADSGWFNRITLGVMSQRGRVDKTDITIETENSRRTPKSDLRFINNYIYSETKGVKSNNQFTSSLRYRRNIASGRMFGQSNTRYMRNTLRNVAADAEQGLGMGVNVLRKRNAVISVGADVAERYRTFVNSSVPAAQNIRRFTTVSDIFQDMSLTINPRFTLTQDAMMLMALDNSDDYKFTFNTKLISKITTFLNLSTEVRIAYDHSLVPEQRQDQRISTSVEYVF